MDIERLKSEHKRLLFSLKKLVDEAGSRFDYVDITEDEVEALENARYLIAEIENNGSKLSL